MEFRIADTFTARLARLTAEEQKAVTTTAFDLQVNPADPGMSFHKLDRVRDQNFWSVRVGSDIRLIVHRSADSLLLCYVDHHDKAYDRAERRKLETHPKTGAARFIEICEAIKEVVVPVYVPAEMPQPSATGAPAKPLFAGVADDELPGYGVPAVATRTWPCMPRTRRPFVWCAWPGSRSGRETQAGPMGWSALPLVSPPISTT